MASRIDELHGHQYSMRRVVSALTLHDPDPGGSRGIRPLTLTLISAVIAAVLAAAVLVYGVLTGQGTPGTLRDSSTVLIEKESGAQFVYLKDDESLHPVLNYASGLLLTDGSGAEPTIARRNRLADLRRSENVQLGNTLGIPGAPNSLPRSGDLIREPWNVCSQGSSAAALRSDLSVGAAALTGGHPLAMPAPRGPAEALLVQPPDRTTTYLIFGNRKLQLRNPAVALTAFGWAGRQGQLVSAAWLNALQQGPDIDTPKIPDLGTRSQVIDAPVGRLLRAPGPNGDQWAVVRRNDVQPVSEVQARLLQADPAVAVGQPQDIDASSFAKLPFDTSAAPAGGQLPVTVPTLQSFTTEVCAQVPDAATGASAVVLDPKTIPGRAPAATAPAGSDATADRVSVPFGHGVLVRALPSPEAPPTAGTVSIVTDDGIRYAIADNAALTKLGYASTTPQNMPAALVSLFPSGPALSTAAAQASQ
jgi:type VII secretion protein EccB